MSLLKGLRQLETAYQTKNWELVLSSYEEIAGEPLDTSNIEVESIEELSNLPQTNEEMVGKTIEFVPKKRGRPKKEKTVPQNTKASIIETKKKTGSEVRWSGNSFVDDGKEFAEDKDFDKKVSKNWKKPPPRPKHEYTTVSCKTCSQTFQMDPSVVTENPMCNRCLAKKGRG